MSKGTTIKPAPAADPHALGALEMFFGLALAHCPRGKGLQISFCDGRADAPITHQHFDVAAALGAEALREGNAKDLVYIALTVCSGVDHDTRSVFRAVKRTAYVDRREQGRG